MPPTNVIVVPTCSICRDDEDGGLNFVATKCGHLFHSDCMNEWNAHERSRGGTLRCPSCNSHLKVSSYDYDTPVPVRIHQLTKHRVLIIEEGKPSPEEQLKAARDNLNSIKVILNKESDKLRSVELEKAKINAECHALKSTIAQLRLEVKINKEKGDSRAADLRKERQTRQKELALHLGDKDRFQKQIADAKQQYEKLRNERGELHKELGKKNADNAKIKGIMANQTSLISTLQAQAAQLNRERDQLTGKLNAIRQTNHGQLLRAPPAQSNPNQHLYPVQALQSNQHFYHSPPVDRAQSDRFVDVLQGLSGGFLKLEREYMGIRKLLEEKNETGGSGRGSEISEKENRQDRAYVEPPQDRLLNTSQGTRFSTESTIDSIQNKPEEIQGLVKKMESLTPPSNSGTDQMIDPRLFG